MGAGSRWAGVAVACVALSGCGGSVRPVTVQTTPIGPVCVGQGPLDSAQVHRLGERVVALRELPFLAEVPVSFVEDAVFEQRVLESMAESPSAHTEQLLGEQAVQASRRRRARFLMAVYSPRSKAVFVRRVLPDGWSEGDLPTLVAHELVHALQEQHFSVHQLSLARVAAHDIDGALALDALLEGEAELIATGVGAALRGAPPRRAMLGLGRHLMLDSRALARAGSVNQALATANPRTQEGVLFPYQFGPRFASALFRVGGAAALDAAWASPPTTTREIFDPAHYVAARPAYRLGELPVAPGFSKRSSTSLGAAGFYRTVSGGNGDPAVRSELFELATHLLADRAMFVGNTLFSKGFQASWVFDSEASAQAAERALRARLVDSLDQLPRLTRLQRSGTRLLLSESIPRALVEPLVAASFAVPLTELPAGRAPRVLPELAPSPAESLAALDPEARRARLGGVGLRAGAGNRDPHPHATWLDHVEEEPDRHLFLVVMGESDVRPQVLVDGFVSGVYRNGLGQRRDALGEVRHAGHAFAGESLRWTTRAGIDSSAQLLHAPVCGGRAALALLVVPAAADWNELPQRITGLETLESSLHCAELARGATEDLAP